MITAPPRVALYGRFSDERQNPSSARDQIAHCEVHAQRNDWQVVGQFTDDAISGRVKQRPQYQALRKAIQNGDVEIVMAEALDRFSRDQEETANLYNLCRYHEVRIFTLSEQWICELHVGFSSTINAVYLKQVREKTHRGLGMRIEAGKSAGGKAYGYRVPVGADGLRATGELAIVPEEATIIVRIMQDYAAGMSPKKIASALNAEGVPAPDGGTWKANTLHGNRQRGTGIVNNEIYIGKRIWNRLRYVHPPGEKHRVSRLNDPSEWKIQPVPDLRIVDDALWARVRSRQDRLDQLHRAKETGDPRRLSGAYATKRPTYLLSGLIRCACCGGSMNIGGSNPKRYYCANARERGETVCKGVPGIAQAKLESLVLDGIRHHLMQPDAVAEFISAFQLHQEKLSAERRDTLARLERKVRVAEKGIANLITAIKAGIITASTKAELERLEREKEVADIALKGFSKAMPAIRIDMAALYHLKVNRLAEALNAPETRQQATEIIRTLVENVIVGWSADSGGCRPPIPE
jgi:DNA invertase Pin-like site-specific DNA recombinase